jgi:hypothetical protein
MNPLDQRQRQATLAAAGLAAVVVLAIWIPQLGSHVTKNKTSPTLALASGLILAGLLAVSLTINKRYIVGVAALFVAFLGPWGSYPLIGIPYAILAGWLVITAGRQAREEAEAKRQAAGGAPSSSTSPRPRSGGLFRRAQPQSPQKPAPRKPPPASKRYTPPKS